MNQYFESCSIIAWTCLRLFKEAQTVMVTLVATAANKSTIMGNGR
jgi:hypothetical protein